MTYCHITTDTDDPKLEEAIEAIGGEVNNAKWLKGRLTRSFYFDQPADEDALRKIAADFNGEIFIEEEP